MASACLSKEMISWEPSIVISPPCADDGAVPCIATLELSNTDLVHNYYNSVLLFYDAQSAAPICSLHQQETNKQSKLLHDEPVSRCLHRAIKELLLHYPSAAGLVVQNEIDGRLEVRYPVPASMSTYNSLTAPGQYVCKNLSSPAEQLGSSDNQNLSKASHINDNNGDSGTPPIYGVKLHVAHADVALSDLGDVSYPQSSLDLLYPNMQKQGCTIIMAFQVTTFKCGGFSLAHTCSHLYADGYTAAAILQNLCSIARGAGVVNPPDFSQSRRVLFKPSEPLLSQNHSTPDIQARPVLSERLHFMTATKYVISMDSLEALRSHVSKPNESKLYSRNQALMAFLWIAYAKVRLQVRRLPASHKMELRFPINLRSKGVFNLTAGYVGNAVYHCTVSATLEELCDNSIAYVVEKIKDKVRSTDLAEGYQEMIDEIEGELKKGRFVPYVGGDHVRMPSMVGLPFYETDFGGWGRPIYASRPSQQQSSLCIILEHPAAQAWNVLSVFASMEERACFEEAIADYFSP